jgi:hypothetical protein
LPRSADLFTVSVSIYRAVVARTKLTTRQLETQAHALSYRAQQLAYVALLQSRGVVGRIDDAFVRGVIRNALIESALSHARALAYFLSGSPHDIDMHFSDFNSDWVDAVSEQTGRIIGLVSEHLAHSQPGDPQGEPHPGAWPVPELAVVLVGAFASLVDAWRAESRTDPGWFTPDPRQTYGRLQAVDVLAAPTSVSEHPDVGKLTTELQDYLQRRGLLAK